MPQLNRPQLQEHLLGISVSRCLGVQLPEQKESRCRAERQPPHWQRFQRCRALSAKHGFSSGFRSLLAEHVVGLLAVPKNPDGTTTDPDTGESYFSNLDHCVHSLETDVDCWVFVARLTPGLFGVPVGRDRVWILAVPRECFALSGLAPHDATLLAQEVLEALTTTTKRDLDDFLLPDSHPAIFGMHAAAVAAVEPRALKRTKRAVGSRDVRWPEQNAQLLAARGVDWWVSSIPDPSVLAVWPCLRLLTYRQFDTLRLEGMGFPDPAGRLIDLSQGGSRARARPRTSSCIVTPGGSIYVGSRCRLLHPLEELHMQSIHYCDKEVDLGKSPPSLLSSLAGNAWECTCAAAMITVQETLLAVLEGGTLWPPGQQAAADKLPRPPSTVATAAAETALPAAASAGDFAAAAGAEDTPASGSLAGSAQLKKVPGANRSGSLGCLLFRGETVDGFDNMLQWEQQVGSPSGADKIKLDINTMMIIVAFASHCLVMHCQQ